MNDLIDDLIFSASMSRSDVLVMTFSEINHEHNRYANYVKNIQRQQSR